MSIIDNRNTLDIVPRLDREIVEIAREQVASRFIVEREIQGRIDELLSSVRK